MKVYMDASDIADLLDISKSKAYEIIRQLNAELEKDGYLVLSGKVPTAYFYKKWYGMEQTTQVVQGTS